jgi:hypothetical protein
LEAQAAKASKPVKNEELDTSRNALELPKIWPEYLPDNPMVV